jgi:hypothetical protein
MNRSTKMGAGFLVHFVFNRIGIHRNFNDDVDYVGDVAPEAYAVEIHAASRWLSATMNRGGWAGRARGGPIEPGQKLKETKAADR